MARPPYFPMMIDLCNKYVLVVGGGLVASRRADTLVRCGAKVVAVSLDFCPSFPQSTQRVMRAFTPGDITSDYALVIAATNSRETNSLIHALAQGLSIPVNVCDSQDECSFFFPSLINHDSVAVSVCSAGTSVRLTKYLSDKLRKVWALWISEGFSLCYNTRNHELTN